MGYRTVDLDEVEVFRGVFYKVRRSLGVRAFGINHVELPPGGEGQEHDEAASGQEEVYVPVKGSGTLYVDGEPVELHPGRYVLVEAASRRKPVAGPDGLTLIAIGSQPDRPHESNPAL